jgi:hypothetical protein
MITCNLKGGLGNQLFQIFTTIAYAMSHNKPFFFLNLSVLGNGDNGSTIRSTYWNSFLQSLKPFLKSMEQMPQFITIREQTFYFTPIPQNFVSGYGIVLDGYYQSYKYFQRYQRLIYTLIKLDIKQQMIRSRESVRDNLDLNSTISLHFRIGDYKLYPDTHPILPLKYYKKALKYVLDENANNFVNVLYFCENVDLTKVEKMVGELKTTFPTLKFCRASPLLSDWEQMLLMSVCHSNIIANSTFSWWGAYLNQNVTKIVCYPTPWFGKGVSHNTTDMFPEDWVPIVC